MRAEPQAFIAIEETMAAVLHKQWDQIAQGLLATLHPLLAAKNWQAAHAAADRLSLNDMVKDVRPRLQELAVAAVCFGAHHVTGDFGELAISQAGTQLRNNAIDGALNLLENGLEQDAADYIRTDLHALIAEYEQQDETAHVQKSNPNHEPAGSPIGGQFASASGASNGQLENQPAAAAAAGPVSDGRGVSGGAGGVAASGRPDLTAPLKGLPTNVTVNGEKLTIGPLPVARQCAIDYMRAAGLPYNPPDTYVKVDPERAAKIAAAFDEMKDAPHDAKVKAAYDQMIKEAVAQWQAVAKTGLKIEWIDYAKDGDPYAASPRLATEDVRKNNHLWVFPTSSGFGSDDSVDVANNPLLADTGLTVSGHRMCANDVFRIVHDYFGHIKEGNGFRADGEENAWRSHSAMFSPLARLAMTTETRGQNSWVNYGPYGAENRHASSAETHFADQKVGLLPEWAMTDGSGQPDDPLRKDDLTEEQLDETGGLLEAEQAEKRKKLIKNNPNHDDLGRFAIAPGGAHPKLDENGKTVIIKRPNVATNYAKLADTKHIAVFTPGKPVEGELNHVAFAPWTDAPTTPEGWNKVGGQNPQLFQPFKSQPGKHDAAGVAIIEHDGRVWLTAPTNQFGGYEATFPKGTVEQGLSLQATAIKEAYEETGLKVRLIGILGDFEKTTSKARIYLAERVGGTPEKMGWESQGLYLANLNHAALLLNQKVDKPILQAVHDHHSYDWVPSSKDRLQKFNPNHDQLGLFATSDEAAEKRDFVSKVRILSPTDELDHHPHLLRALAAIQSAPLTNHDPKWGGGDNPSQAWQDDRIFSFGGETVKGYTEAFKRLNAKAESYSTDGRVQANKQAFLVLGPPAAGKSKLSEEIAVSEHAAIVDPDDAKAVLPEFRGGVGANAVHEESSYISKKILAQQIEKGHNLLLPRVGDKAPSIDKLIQELKKHGYDVHLVNLKVSPAVAYRRMLGRFASTGRLIPPAYFKSIGSNPTKVYNTLARKVTSHAEVYGDPRPELQTSHGEGYAQAVITAGLQRRHLRGSLRKRAGGPVREEEARKSELSLAQRLNDAVKNGGQVHASLAANMTTSRLVALGFLAQATDGGETEYQVNEVLDDKTCPVCRYMHGRRFKVQSEYSRLMQTLQTQDPQALKALAPWPSQSKASVSALKAQTEAELQAGGLGSPPYHPHCRGMLALVSTVEPHEALGTEEAAVEDEVPDNKTPTVSAATPEPEITDWDAASIEALRWAQFEVTDPVVFAEANAAFEEGDYDTASAIIDNWKAQNVAKKEDITEGPNVGKPKTKRQNAAGQEQEYSDIKPDSSDSASVQVANDVSAPLDRR